MTTTRKDRTGQKVGRLTFIRYLETNERGNAVWLVRCDCGTVFEVTASSVKSGQTKSCGCIRRERCLSGFKKFL